MTAVHHRLCLAVDVAHYHHRTLPQQRVAQTALRELLDAAWQGIEADRQPQGDGEVSVAAPGTDEAHALARMTRTLRDGLAAVNAGADLPLRVRVAAHAGHVEEGANGFVGHAVVRACRMVSSAALRQALEDNPASDLVVMVSETFLEDVVSREQDGLRVADFRPVDVVDAAKGFTARGFVHVPDTRAAPPAVAAAPASPTLRVDVTGEGRVQSLVQIGELHGGLTIALPPERR